MTKNKHWANIEERGSLLGMKLLFAIYRLLGRRILLIFLFPVVLYIYATGKAARTASRNFLTQVNYYNGNKKSASWLAGLKHFLAFADSAFDKIDAWLGNITTADILYNQDGVMQSIIENKKGAIFIGSHLGNIEVCRALSQGRYHIPINVLVFTENAIKFNEILKKVADNVSVNLIQLSNIGPELAISLQEKVNQGEIIVIVGDRTSVSVAGRVVYSPFIGKEAPFSQGPFILAALLKCPIYWLFCLKEGKKFRVIFEHVSDELALPRKQRTQVLESFINQYADRLSFYAAKYPQQWFNFYDFWQQDQAVSRKESNGESKQ
ncbi:hypothetical protein GCM10009111_19270 [Colwellia asteriadis]|uniref:Acyltransferase n=1 Tax=Colwellia asteriadis TaxID=517723 RepID=A0ABN1L7Y7_9GAMM